MPPVVNSLFDPFSIKDLKTQKYEENLTPMCFHNNCNCRLSLCIDYCCLLIIRRFRKFKGDVYSTNVSLKGIDPGLEQRFGLQGFHSRPKQ